MTDALTWTAADIERFMSFVDVLPCGCWFWMGARSRGKGKRKWYGSFHVNGQTVRALRFSCEAIGKMPPVRPGEHRAHRCMFSMCVNPDCIDIVPEVVNQEQRIARGPPGLLRREAQARLIERVNNAHR